MKIRFALVWAAASVATSMIGCGDDETVPEPIEHEVHFAGYVYDGASGARLTDYVIRGAVRDAVQDGDLDEEGRYALGPFDVWQDYTIVIEAPGYRFFRSNNAGIDLPTSFQGSEDIGNYSTSQTLHFDAYLFPDDVPAPSVAFTIRLADDPESDAAGKIRLRPVASSVLANSDLETPAGVAGQLWTNDEDLQGRTVTATFSDGLFEVAEGELVYGVAYQVDVFEVSGYQPFQGTFTAGVDAGKTFTLQPENQEPLTVLETTIASCAAPSSPAETEAAVVTITFNRSAEFGATSYPGGNEEALDDGFSISSPDSDIDLERNLLAADGLTSAQLRGVSATFAGNVLTLSWSPADGLISSDPQDPIDLVTYGGLANVVVQPIGRTNQAVALSSLVGASISCF